MQFSNSSLTRFNADPDRSLYSAVIVGSALAALAATFIIAGAEIEVGLKTRAFSAIIASFLVVAALAHLFVITRKRPANRETDEGRGLSLLDEANELLAGRLNTSDTFRLVVSRLSDLVPFERVELFLLDETRSRLVPTETSVSTGETPDNDPVSWELATRALEARSIQRGGSPIPSIALPLTRDGQVFGVLQFVFGEPFDLNSIDPMTCEAIAERVGPLFLSAQAFDKSRANALTDTTTDLPNERAFCLILENQIAEAMRKGGERPLTVIAFDIRGFDDINQSFGHAAGDRVLNFVATEVSVHLRNMDFFARAMGDEFLAILPTASKEVAHEVIARLQTGFFGRRFKLTETDSVEIDLNFGWAAFGEDGDEARSLLSIARIRKDQTKYSGRDKILWFPSADASS